MGSLFPSPGDLPGPGIEPRSLALQVVFLPAEPHGKPMQALSTALMPKASTKDSMLTSQYGCAEIFLDHSLEGNFKRVLSLKQVFYIVTPSMPRVAMSPCYGRFTCFTVYEVFCAVINSVPSFTPRVSWFWQ